MYEVWPMHGDLPDRVYSYRRVILYEGLFKLPEESSLENSFFDLIATRRAIRNFQDKPVPRELLEKIVQAIAFAPPGFPPIKTEIVVVQDTAIIRKALPYMIEVYDFLLKAMNNPIPQAMPCFNEFGTAFIIFSRNPHNDRTTNNIPDIQLAPSAVCQGIPMPKHTVYTKKKLCPIAGPNAIG
jgi:hypothetical protein